jgi:Zn-dependent peptidase ImmA (M78 family)
MNPESDARQILGTVWAPNAPDASIPLPVNPFAIAQRLGIKAFTAGLDEGISGILVKRAGQDAEIYVHASDSPNRQRFTCAHELGHYVKRSAAGDETWEYVEHRNLLTAQGTDTEEIYANQFAASLLMPEEAVRQLYAKLTEERGATPPAAALAFEFGVSADAMQYRLANLGLE